MKRKEMKKEKKVMKEMEVEKMPMKKMMKKGCK